MTTTYLAFFDDDGGCQVEIHVHAPAEEVREWLTTVADFPANRQPAETTTWFVRIYSCGIPREHPRIELRGIPFDDPVEWMTDKSEDHPDNSIIAWDVGPWCEITYDPEP